VELSSLGRVLLVVAVVIAVVGVLFVVAGAVGLGKLPGDLAIRRGNVRAYAPIGTCILLSVLLTIVFSVFRR